MLQCTGKEIIYVICSAQYKTGGTELLHQLVYSLRKDGLNAYITYVDMHGCKNPINDAFKEYVSEYKILDDIIDRKENIVILPEIQMKLIRKFSKAKTIVWWLSVDNYLKVYTPGYALKLVGTKGLVWYLKNCYWRYRISKIRDEVTYNLAQSYYAMDFLKRNGFKNIAYLSDYIGNVYLKQNYLLHKTRNDVVLYNPQKGMKFTKQLMKYANNLKWIPIINMTNEQVRNLLNSSKVYVDFGNHPGKDRFPREAAYCGCCIITGKAGSANYFEDVPIGDLYKYDDCTENIPSIVKMIHNCLSDFEEHQKDFVSYGSMFQNEKPRFEEEVKNLFLS
jgi:hypothetical protein